MVSARTRHVGFGRRAASLLICALTLLPAAAAPVVAAGEAHDAAHLRTRFVIALERDAQFQVSALAQPNRVVIDLPDMRIGLPNEPGNGPAGLVSSFRSGLTAPGQQRVVIDVTMPVVVEKAKIEHDKSGRHLVIEIIPASAAKQAAKTLAAARVGNAGLAGIQPPLPRRAMKPSARAAASFKPVLVIDPGHGGHDSGAQRNGTVEKDAVLAFSLVLAERLRATGRYTVLMTRSDDTFVPLDDRRDFAERNKAALFMAIHADYAGSSAQGATIYSLRDSVANELRRSAAGEVAHDVLSEREVQALKRTEVADAGAVSGFLADLARREVAVTQERTNVLARSMIENMGDATTMMSNPDRTAAYRVLKTAKVPSVLVELAYVTNRQDAANLKSDAWRHKVAASIVTAIDNYFSHQLARLPL
ncbi:MAG: N-acetylmuramoyl-L-alanine amidase [Proteobacteria bacterium]|nr:N-acetylmuramoyl-L-alanine amidase [Pseudomonadota bacterium]